MSYLQHLKEVSINSVKIKLLNNTEVKQFISTINHASPSYKKEKYDVYGAILGKNIVGGIVINKDPNLTVYKKYKLKCDAVLAFIYLTDKYRKMGLGQKLLNIPMKKYNYLGLTTNKGFTTRGAYELAKKNKFRIIENKGQTTIWYWSKQ